MTVIPLKVGAVPLLISIVVVAGLVLRLAMLLTQGSLHMDEAAIARNIMERSWMELATPLTHSQASPLLHLWSCKAAVMLLGIGEWQLRLPAMLAGMAAVACFAALAWNLLRPGAAIIATSLMALLPASIYYSAFIKPYAFDLAAATFLLLAGLQWRKNPDLLRWIVLCTAGIISCWFSFASPMILGGIGLALIVENLTKGQWRRLGALVICCALWLGSFLAMWLLIAGKSAQDPLFEEYWKNAFLPLIPRSPKDLGVLVYHFFHLFESSFLSPYGHPRANLTPFVAGLLAMLCITGASQLWRSNRILLLMLTLPPMLAAVASWLHLYPFRWRFLLFASPAVLLLACTGMQTLTSWAISRNHRRLTWISPALLMLIASANTAQLFYRHEGTHQQMRKVLAEMARNVRSGDLVVVHDASVLAFEFYQQFVDECRLPGVTVVTTSPTTDFPGRLRDADQVRGQHRVWYLYEREWTIFPDFFPELGMWSALVQRDGARELHRVQAGHTIAALFDYSQTMEPMGQTTNVK